MSRPASSYDLEDYFAEQIAKRHTNNLMCRLTNGSFTVRQWLERENTCRPEYAQCLEEDAAATRFLLRLEALADTKRIKPIQYEWHGMAGGCTREVDGTQRWR